MVLDVHRLDFVADLAMAFVWDRLLAAGRGSEKSVWCLLTGRWKVVMGRGGNVVSTVGGGSMVFAVCGGLAEEEDGLVTLGSKGDIGGDFAKAGDGEGCLVPWYSVFGECHQVWKQWKFGLQ